MPPTISEKRARAVDEQLSSAFPDPGSGPWKKGRFTLDQLRGRRRRAETIFNDMCEKPGSWRPPKPQKSSARKRKRGPKTLVAKKY
jgi:hypothetical protein